MTSKVTTNIESQENLFSISDRDALPILSKMDQALADRLGTKCGKLIAKTFSKTPDEKALNTLQDRINHVLDDPKAVSLKENIKDTCFKYFNKSNMEKHTPLTPKTLFKSDRKRVSAANLQELTFKSPQVTTILENGFEKALGHMNVNPSFNDSDSLYGECTLGFDDDNLSADLDMFEGSTHENAAPSIAPKSDYEYNAL